MVFISLREGKKPCCQKLSLGQKKVMLCAGDSLCACAWFHLLHGAAERELLTTLGKYLRVLNIKGVWEKQRASRGIFCLVGPVGFSKYLICQMMAI